MAGSDPSRPASIPIRGSAHQNECLLKLLLPIQRQFRTKAVRTSPGPSTGRTLWPAGQPAGRFPVIVTYTLNQQGTLVIVFPQASRSAVMQVSLVMHERKSGPARRGQRMDCTWIPGQQQVYLQTSIRQRSVIRSCGRHSSKEHQHGASNRSAIALQQDHR